MNASESKSGGWRVQCDGASAVHEMTALACDFAVHHGLASSDAARLAIVIEEIVTNAIEHGQVGDGDRLDLMIALEAGGVRIIFAEPGLPYDPRQASCATQEQAERGGGAGIELVKAWTDIVDYRTVDGINRLELLLVLNTGEIEM